MSNKVVAPPCPFWAAAATDQSAVDPNAPAAIDPTKRAKVGQAAEMLEYHADMTGAKKWAVAELLVVAANKGFGDKVKGALTQTFTLNHLSGGLLDKELDTGMLHGDPAADLGVGEFSQKAFETMFSAGNSSHYQLDGKSVRGMSDAQLTAFVEKNAKASNAGGIHKVMAHAEMKDLLLGIFGRAAKTAEGKDIQVVSQRSVEVFFKNGIFPHARLDAKVDALFPSSIGANLAAGGDGAAPERMAGAGTKGACPFMGMMAPPPAETDTVNPAFAAHKDTPEKRIDS